MHGVAEPARPAWLPNDGSAHPLLPAGAPYGLVGMSSFYKRESAPGYASTQAFDGLDQFNTAENEFNGNWFWQGADVGKYANSDIWAVRILAIWRRPGIRCGRASCAPIAAVATRIASSHWHFKARQRRSQVIQFRT